MKGVPMGSANGRRDLLKGFVLAAGSALLGDAAAARPPSGAAASISPQLAHRRLAGAADGDVAYSWLRGRRYGLSQGVLHPFWDMYVGTIFQVRDMPDDGYEIAALSVSVYADPETGVQIRQFDNPFTGKRSEIPAVPPTPKVTLYRGTMAVQPTAERARTRVETIGPCWVEGGEVHVDVNSSVHMTAGGREVRVNDLTSYSGRVADVLDPRRTNTPARIAFNDVNGWPAWMGMDAIEGVYFSRCVGAKVFAYDDLPAFWREQMAIDHQEIARDPARALRR